MKKKAVVLLGIGVAMMLSIGQATVCRADETGLFTSIAPDAMIVLDLSGSMKWNPPGNHDSWNNPTYEYSDSTCSGPFYDDNWHSGYTTYCSRFEIARKTLFNMLDDNRNGTIDSQDETSLNIRIGLGKFQDSSYTKLRDIATKYSLIYCGNSTSCTIDQSSGDSSNIRYWMSYSKVVGATPLVTGPGGHQGLSRHPQGGRCVQVLPAEIRHPRNRRGRHDVLRRRGLRHRGRPVQAQAEAVLARTKALADAGYRVFVIGMAGLGPANMPLYLKRTLNWMAYYGGTDNPLTRKQRRQDCLRPRGGDQLRELLDHGDL